MKKLLVILLLMVYGVASFGATVHFHYCCGKLKKVDFTAPKESGCESGKTHMMGSKPCCDNKAIDIKIKDEQTASKMFQLSFPFDVVEPIHYNYFVLAPLQNKRLVPEIFAPPPLNQDFTHLYCVYRI